MVCQTINSKRTVAGIGISLVFLIVIFSTSGCYYDNEQDLYLGLGNACDTTTVTYTASLAPIFASYCNSCHSGSAPSGNMLTDSYANVKSNITNIHGAVNHLSGHSPMPQNGNKLSDCDLAKIDIWIRNGMKNN